ncbi:MAG: hypothetical protein K2K30_03965 [Alistipes sp.]|nr:hypothetical protein [Alistipes sp.]
MANKEGFIIELSSRSEIWWKYNATLMCGCFDSTGARIGFASAESFVAEVGSGLRERPADIDPHRSLTLETPSCDHLLLYVYIVPHRLPEHNDVSHTQPFDVQLTVSHDGRRISRERIAINQWSGCSLEMRIPSEKSR